jgi:PadR family transcriptional regulator PadR
MRISKELMKGSTSLLVLSVIERKDMYGYQIIKDIELRSEKVFTLNEGTLYPILHSLEKEKLLVSYWDESESARKRKYYRMTDKGRKELARKREEWRGFSAAIARVTEGTALLYV